MQQTQTLRYDVSPKGPIAFPPADLDRKKALSWVTQFTNKGMGLSQEPDLSQTADLTEDEAVFLLYYMYKYGNSGVALSESHLLAPTGRPSAGKVPCAYIRLRYLPDRASAAILKRTQVEQDAPVTTAATPEDIENLRSEFGLGPVTAEGGTVWTDRQLKMVRVAMMWLPKPHRVVLSGLALVRVRQSSDPNEAGHFAWGTDGENRLELSNSAFERDLIRFDKNQSFVPAGFVGGSRIGPQGLRSILHELGHAVEAYRLRVDATQLKRTADSTNASYRTLHQERQDLLKQWEQAKALGSSDAPRLADEWKAKNKAADAAEAEFEKALGAYDDRVAQGSRLLDDFSKQVLAQETAITSYGRKNAKEGFAESYAGLLVDPELLQANAPRAYAWLQALSAAAL